MINPGLVDLFSQPIIFCTLIGLLGLVVGSFLNVVVYRLPKVLHAEWRQECCELLGQKAAQEAKLSLAFPASHCPHCKAAIKPWHNIPVVSWLALGGKCHACKKPISKRYPLVEAISGLMSLAVALQFGPNPETIALLLLSWTLIALTLIDADTMLLPDNLTLPLMWAGLVVNYFGYVTDFDSAFWGAIAGYGVLWLVFWGFKLLTGKDGMGYGDFKLLAALGAWLGWQSLPLIILLSSFVGAAWGLSQVLLRGRDNQQPMPFGPYLAVAGWIAMMWGEQLTSLYLNLTGIGNG